MYKKRCKLGILSNEFFDLTLGRMGGFGWAARQVTTFFQENKQFNFDIVLLAGSKNVTSEYAPSFVHDVPIIYRARNPLKYMNMLYKEKLDCILTIDYRSSYRKVLNLLPFTPTIVWVRDPRTLEDVKRVQSIRLPDQQNIIPEGLEYVDCTSIAKIVSHSKLLGRKIQFATTTPYLQYKIPGTYGVDPKDTEILPNIINIRNEQIVKNSRPMLVFLGRLDPYKRPWIFLELANYFPNVDFLFLGQPHFTGNGSWNLDNIPKNVQLKGHVGEEEKTDYLSRAWVLINTSVHEGLAVSFLEALKLETPLLSSVNPENIVSRFGIYVGNYTGTGQEAIPYFVESLTKLIEQKDLREQLGKRGRTWVEQEHNPERFYQSFQNICDKLEICYE